MKTKSKFLSTHKSCLIWHFSKPMMLSLLFISISVSVSAETYYVSPNGGDSNPGTENQPWKTIQKAANTVTAGDLVYIKAGTYNERIIPKNSGSANNYIVYSAYPGDTVSIDGGEISLPADWGGLFHLEEKNYIKIIGLKIMNAGHGDNSAGILLDGCKHIIIENNRTYNTTSSGIGVWNSEDIIITGNDVELACNDGEQECISVASTNNFEIIGNHVFNGGPGSMGGEGIDAKDGSYNGKICKNVVHDIPYRLGIYVEAWDKHTYNIDVFNNVVYKCGGDGMTMASEMGGLLENISVYNNIVYENKNVGITVTPNGEVSNPPMTNIKIINNTIFNNGWNVGADPWGGGIGVDNPNLSNLTVRNNIVSQNLFFQIAIGHYGENLFIDHNLIDGFRGELSEEIRGADFVEGEPLFMNVSDNNFHLQSNSPAIDRGSSDYAPLEDFDGNSRPVGTGFDIGAFEYGYTSIEQQQHTGISSYELFQNYPNPFNSSTKIRFTLTKSEKVKITIYDVLGKQVLILADKKMNAGTHAIEFNAENLAGGLYFCSIQAASKKETIKMLLLK